MPILNTPCMQSRQSQEPPTVHQSPVRGATYGERIAAALSRAGKKRSWLAKEIGVQWQTVDSWVKGTHQPEGENLERAARALDMSPAELLGILDGQEPPFPAWADFLATPEAQTITDAERRTLAGIPWPPGTQPTLASYRIAFTALRTTEPR